VSEKKGNLLEIFPSLLCVYEINFKWVFWIHIYVFFFYFELSLFFCLFTWSVCKPNNLWKLHDVFKTTSNSRKEKKKKLNKFLRSSLVSFFIVFSNFFFCFSTRHGGWKFSFVFSSHHIVAENCYFIFVLESVWEVFESCQYEEPFFFIHFFSCRQNVGRFDLRKR
jgi:hypothetical protein